MIFESSVQAVIDISRIEEVVRDYVNLRPRGSNLTGLCPFHKEKTPSFSVSPSKNIYKCFGCGKAGNSVQFMMEVENLSFPEAIRALAKRYNITLEESKSHDYSEENTDLQSLNIINEWAKEYFKKQLWETSEGQNIAYTYLKERGFLDSTIQKFELGFAHDEYSHFTDECKKENYSLEFAKELGLISQSEKDFFRNRVMFPIHSQSGKTIGFAGRVMGTDVKLAKYINSPESRIYNKSKTLYGLHLAKNSIRKNNFAILVEGYTDVISLVQSGVENVVASSGTSLTEDQAQILSRLSPNVTILYDGDQAGIKATLRGIDIMIKAGMNVHIATIPDGDDPDSFIKKHGSEEFQKFLDTKSKDFILYKVEMLSEESKNNPILRTNAIKDIVTTLALIEDPIKRSVYIQSSASLVGVSEETLIDACNLILKDNIRNRQFQQQRQALENDRSILNDTNENKRSKSQNLKPNYLKDELQEMELAKVIVSSSSRTWKDSTSTVGEFIVTNIEDIENYITLDAFKSLVQVLKYRVDSHLDISPNYFINHPDPWIHDLAIEAAVPKYEYSKKWGERHDIYLMSDNPTGDFLDAEIEQIIKYIKVKKFDIVIASIDEKIIEETDLEAQYDLIKIREEYKKIRNQINSEVWNQE
ncbi:MAG: DNA primase [Saprospiraceae bacterium]|nr:DNA primase [Saprospiraceae bacterium]